MSIKAQSADGVIHEFPNGTSQDVIDAAMRRYAEESRVVVERAPRQGALGRAADIVEGLYLGARQPLDVLASRLESAVPGGAEISRAFGPTAASVLREQQVARAQSPANVSEAIGQGVGVVPLLAAGGVSAAPATYAGAAGVGGLTGALTSEAQTFGDFALDVGTGTALGVPGKAIGDVISGTIAPRVSEGVRKLRDLGVELTPGAILGARGDTLGRLANVAESALTSVPGLGVLVDYARNQTSETFERAAVNQLAKSVGLEVPPNLKGGQAVGWLRGEIGKQYEELLPSLRMRLPENWSDEALNIFESLDLPENRTELLDDFVGVISKSIKRVADAGELSGKNLQNSLSSLGDNARSLMRSSDGFTRRVGAGLNEFRNWMMDTLANQNEEAAGALRNLNKAWNAQTVLDKATSYASDAITPTTLNRAVKSLNKGRIQGVYGELAQAGAEIPRSLQDSGTAIRLATMQALGLGSLGGVAGGSYALTGEAPSAGDAATTLGLLGALYLPAGRKTAQAILSREAGPVSRSIAQGFESLTTPLAAAVGAEPAVKPTSAVTFSMDLPDGTTIPLSAPPGADGSMQLDIAMRWLKQNRPDLVRAKVPVAVNYGE